MFYQHHQEPLNQPHPCDKNSDIHNPLMVLKDSSSIRITPDNPPHPQSISTSKRTISTASSMTDSSSSSLSHMKSQEDDEEELLLRKSHKSNNQDAMDESPLSSSPFSPRPFDEKEGNEMKQLPSSAIPTTFKIKDSDLENIVTPTSNPQSSRAERHARFVFDGFDDVINETKNSVLKSASKPRKTSNREAGGSPTSQMTMEDDDADYEGLAELKNELSEAEETFDTMDEEEKGTEASASRALLDSNRALDVNYTKDKPWRNGSPKDEFLECSQNNFTSKARQEAQKVIELAKNNILSPSPKQSTFRRVVSTSNTNVNAVEQKTFLIVDDPTRRNNTNFLVQDDDVSHNDDDVSPTQATSKTVWSQRYSVDQYRTALGGSLHQVRGTSFSPLPKGEGEGTTTDINGNAIHNGNNSTANNLYTTSPHSSNSKSRSTPNKNTTWMEVNLQDMSPDSVASMIHLNDACYEESLRRNRINRRRFLICLGLCLVALAAIIAAMSNSNREGSTAPLGDNDGSVTPPSSDNKKKNGVEDKDDVASSTPGGPSPPIETNNQVDHRKVSFCVTSDMPYNQVGDKMTLQSQFSNLPSDAEFLIHLGDIDQSKNTPCPEAVYSTSAEVLAKCPIPLFILPGDEDWNECPDPAQAWGYWEQYLGNFEERYEPMMKIDLQRQFGRNENFAFLQGGVLFIGLNLVNGTLPTHYDWNEFHQENIEWTLENMFGGPAGVTATSSDDIEEDKFRAVVLMGHSPPSHDAVEDYFLRLADEVEKLGKPVLYLHASDGEEWKEYKPFPERTDRLIAVQTRNGSEAPPARVTVSFGDHPFSFNQEL